ncbi:MAG: Lrp/AsnC family transcriptional regulator [Rhodospirillaceae bacterium]|nr:Lrp/AsnC family transcriptional regulator [Rhodospirillaceae bacterium]
MSVKLDEADLRILRCLQSDASVSMDELAAKANLSRNACWRRVKQLEERQVIRGRVALIDPDTVDLGLSVFVIIRTSAHEKDWLGKFEEAVRTLPEIQGAHRMTGDIDYVLRLRVPNVKGYDRFYKRLIAKVPISEISASFVMDDIKDTTALPI